MAGSRRNRCGGFFFLAFLTLFFSLFSLFCGTTEGAVKYVTRTGSGGKSGASWSDSLDEGGFRSALDGAQPGTEFWVARGRYRPVTSLGTVPAVARSASFALKTGVALYGGFAGTETSRDQRDPGANVTVLTGDIELNDTVNGDGVTLNLSNIAGSNSYTVVKASGVSHTAILDGFTITGGKADGDSAGAPDNSASYGGGFFALNSTPTITNCSFTGNDAYWGGGGLCSTAGGPIFTKCTFSGNTSRNGAGMYNDSGNPLLAECSFLENTAYQTGGGMYSRSGRPVLSDCLFSKNTSNDGGGMHNFDSAAPVLTDCVFSENKAAKSGGGMGNVKNSAPEMTGCSFVNNRTDDLSQGGGAIASTESAPKITECSFSGNSARVKGGALYSYSCQGTAVDCDFSGNSADSGGAVYNTNGTSTSFSGGSFSGNAARMGAAIYNSASSPSLTKVLFSENTASDSGGGVYNYSGSSPAVTECVFSENTAKRAGGMGNTSSSNPVVTACTFSGNTASSDHGGGMLNSGSAPEIRRCLFHGNVAKDMGGGMLNLMGSPVVINCTFAGNDGVRGAAAANFQSTVTMRSSTLAGNEGSTAAGIYTYDGSFSAVNCIFWNPSGAEIVSAGGASATVTDSVVRGGYSGMGNITADPRLGSLAWNGGPTRTMGLLSESSAIDAAAAFFSPSVDQRGVSRPQKNGHDMGAYEAGIRKMLTIRASLGGLFRFSTAGMEFPSGMGETWSFMGGTSLTVTFVPDAGKAVKEVLVDEVSIGPAGSLTFSDLDRDHFVEVIFDTAPATEGGGGCSGGGIPGAAAVILLVPLALAPGRKNKG
ncbi:MAG: right-handed parallel beta-helix repeat-containing protein [Synergistaceae bacterium]|nr:right-handed parallel beta-helix repeat-containing protein [Synergistaceae bacterium]